MQQNNISKYRIFFIPLILFAAIIMIAFFDVALAEGIALIFLLFLATYYVLLKFNIARKGLLLLLLIGLIIHFTAVLFIYYGNFQPFSGGQGDYNLYNDTAKEIAGRVRVGNFSLEGDNIFTNHIYPIILGYVYALTFPSMLVGQLLNLWIVMVSMIFVYLIVIEIGASENHAFLVGLIACFYPSYLFFGSLLLKDALVVALAFASLFLIIKLIKRFSWLSFLIFYIVLGFVVHFRFYLGYALIATFILCWILLSRLHIKERIIYGVIMIIVIGFLPIFSGYGYYGYKSFEQYLKPKTITAFREKFYSNPVESPRPVAEVEVVKGPVSAPVSASKIAEKEKETNSTIAVKTEINKPLRFLINWINSFFYTLMGPFPWQIKSSRELYALLETVPWYFLLFFSIRGAFSALTKQRVALPLLVFAIILLAVLGLFIPNFGIILRIRIPAFLALACLTPLGFKNIVNINLPYLDKYLS